MEPTWLHLFFKCFLFTYGNSRVLLLSAIHNLSFPQEVYSSREGQAAGVFQL